MEAWRYTTGVQGNRAESSSEETGISEESWIQPRGTSALKAARMRRCLKLRQGASPLRPPAPFPSNCIIRRGARVSRVRYAGQLRAALDTLAPLRRKPLPYIRERGPSERRPLTDSSVTTLEGSPGKNYFLDSRRPSHGSPERKRV